MEQKSVESHDSTDEEKVDATSKFLSIFTTKIYLVIILVLCVSITLGWLITQSFFDILLTNNQNQYINSSSDYQITELEEQFNFASVYYDSVGVSITHPVDYKVIHSDSYPLPFTLIVNDEHCVDFSSQVRRVDFNTDYDDCVNIQIWQQDKRFEFNESVESLTEYTPFTSKNGVIGYKRLQDQFGTKVITLEFPRHVTSSEEPNGYLIVQMAFRWNRALNYRGLEAAVLNNLDISTDYISQKTATANNLNPVIFHQSNQISILKDGIISSVPFQLPEGVYIDSTVLSPTKDRIVFSYYNKKGMDQAPKYGLFRTGIGILGLSTPYKQDFVFPVEDLAYHDLQWSPDGRYVSYLIDGKGGSMGIYDTKNKVETFRLYSEGNNGAGGLRWLSDDTFTHINNGKLYLGTVKEPNQTIVAEGVVGEYYNFEGPSTAMYPYWSPSKRYVVYPTQTAWMIKDVTQNTTQKLGNISLEAFMEDGTEILIDGWDSNNTLLISKIIEEKDRLVRLNFEDGAVKESVLLPSNHIGGKIVNDIYMMTGWSGSSDLTMFDLKSNTALCADKKFGPYIGHIIEGDSITLFTQPANLPVSFMGNNNRNIETLVTGVWEIHDVKTCSTIGGMPIPFDGYYFNIDSLLVK